MKNQIRTVTEYLRRLPMVFALSPIPQ